MRIALQTCADVPAENGLPGKPKLMLITSTPNATAFVMLSSFCVTPSRVVSSSHMQPEMIADAGPWPLSLRILTEMMGVSVLVQQQGNDKAQQTWCRHEQSLLLLSGKGVGVSHGQYCCTCGWSNLTCCCTNMCSNTKTKQPHLAVHR